MSRRRKITGSPGGPVQRHATVPSGRAAEDAPQPRSATRLRLLILAAVTLATLIAYQPAWHGGILWDDDGHFTRAELTSPSGLWRIWFEPGATQQYYPVVHSAFWFFNHLWGRDTTGYHIANIVLHALSAWLVWILLVRLAIPGALLAAVVFALHPVHVESVAWITELKNVLSGVFYLSAFLAYLRYDEGRRSGSWRLAFGLFALAVFSKTVTVTLPAAMLVVLWWRRGRLRVAEDVRPLIPFFVVGVMAGLMTVWVERTFIGAEGAEFELSILQRLLLAGTVIWFYAGKLLWPADLIFVYPRWTIDSSHAVWWLGLVIVVVAAAVAWRLRARTRAPLAVLLLFAGTLLPALGFFDVYPFRFSFVADHFQYLASVPVIAAVAALIARSRTVELTAIAPLGVLLGALTWHQAHMYADAETLYRTTIARNPEAWIAYNNLAVLLLEGEPGPGRLDEARGHLEAAIQLNPAYAEAHYNLGTIFERLEQRAEADAAYRRVLEISPGERRALRRLAAVRHDRASALLEQGVAHENAGRLADAADAYRSAAAFDPSRAVIHSSLGRVLQKAGRREEAVAAYQRALRVDAQSFETHNDLGVLLAELGRIDEAIEHFRAALQLRPEDEGARANLVQAEALRRR